MLQCLKNTTDNNVNENNIQKKIIYKNSLDGKHLCDKNDKIFDFCNFNLNRSFNRRSQICEVTLPLLINNIKVYALLDSGSESSILTLKYTEKFFKNWRNFQNGFFKLDFGIGVDGFRFK